MEALELKNTVSEVKISLRINNNIDITKEKVNLKT